MFLVLLEAVATLFVLGGLSQLFNRWTGWNGLLLMALGTIPAAIAVALGSTTINPSDSGDDPLTWYQALFGGSIFLLIAIVWRTWANARLEKLADPGGVGPTR
jgi:hypothetical protein